MITDVITNDNRILQSKSGMPYDMNSFKQLNMKSTLKSSITTHFTEGKVSLLPLVTEHGHFMIKAVANRVINNFGGDEVEKS